MNLDETADSASRFAAFVGELASAIGHADRVRPLNDYCAGLLVSEGRRSVEPIAAATAPAEVSVQADCLQAVSAQGLDRRRSPSQESAYSQGDFVQDQTADRA